MSTLSQRVQASLQASIPIYLIFWYMYVLVPAWIWNFYINIPLKKGMNLVILADFRCDNTAKMAAPRCWTKCTNTNRSQDIRGHGQLLYPFTLLPQPVDCTGNSQAEPRAEPVHLLVQSWVPQTRPSELIVDVSTSATYLASYSCVATN